MVMSPPIGEDFVGWKPPTGSDSMLGIVDFSIFPHLDHADLPENTMADAERWAAGIRGPAYPIDDEAAIRVTDGTVDVVSEGHWKLFSSCHQATQPFARDSGSDGWAVTLILGHRSHAGLSQGNQPQARPEFPRAVALGPWVESGLIAGRREVR
jgi:hypothetical protein